MKRLKNIEDKNEEQLKAIKSKSQNITNFVKEPLSLEAKELYKNMLITENQKLEAVAMLIMILVITKHLKSYLKTFIT